MLKEKLSNEPFVKGHYKISLFEDNKLVHEEKGHNFITKVGKELLKRRQAMLVGSGITGLDSRIIDTIATNYDPISRLLLTDADEPENPEKDIFLWGNVIGSAVRKTPYSGSSKELGTINPSESTVTRDKTHLVFDFPTHACNGTIKSLGFVDGAVDVTSSIFTRNTLSSGSFHALTDTFGFKEGNNIYMRKGQANDILVYDKALNKLINVPLGVSTRTLFKIGTSAYVSKSPFNSTSFFKLSQDRKSITDEKFSLNKAIPDIYLVKALGDGKLYVFSNSISIDLNTQVTYRDGMYIFNELGEFIETVVMPLPFHYTYDLVLFEDGTISLPTTQGTLYNPVSGEFKASTRINGIVYYDDDERFLTQLHANAISDVLPSTLFTKVVLETPVVKTNTQTMKLEYDFTYKGV